MTHPRSASSSDRVWVMILVGSISPRSMRSSSVLVEDLEWEYGRPVVLAVIDGGRLVLHRMFKRNRWL